MSCHYYWIPRGLSETSAVVRGHFDSTSPAHAPGYHLKNSSPVSVSAGWFGIGDFQQGCPMFHVSRTDYLSTICPVCEP